MQKIFPYSIYSNTFLLSQDRCIFWEEEKTLILSDLHFGKTGHFRKSGIAVPQNIFKEDIQRFVSQLQIFKPAKVIIIGDMFHSHSNMEHDLFLKWRKDFSQIDMQLVMGNHDILQQGWYSHAGIEVINHPLNIDAFSFVHDITEIENNQTHENYFFSGHIHPGISIRGMGKQSLNFPCFYFAKKYAVLPAFSRFTGSHGIKPQKGESVFAIITGNHSNNQAGGILKVM